MNAILNADRYVKLNNDKITKDKYDKAITKAD